MGQRRRLKVLVVEDEALLRWSIGETLRGGGHTVTEAASAGRAREAMALASGAIDVVLLDVSLPGSRDLTFLDEIRRTLPQSAVVLMTALATPEVVEGAHDRGVHCVLIKPFDMRDIEGVITQAFRAARRHEEPR
jgi:DNA-binding NtrC family response regulator